MQVLKKFLIGFIMLLCVIAISVFVYVETLKPVYKGSVHLKEAAGTEIYFDSIGVPHIYADTEQKAMTALGYVHAKERLWQMELLRRIASGRLAEILGEDLLDVDVFFAHLGIDETVVKQVKYLEKNPEIKKLATAYLVGVNNFIEKGTTPIEFTLLGVEKEKYTLKDMYYVSAYMAFSFAHAFKTDPLLSYIQQNLGEDYLKDLPITTHVQNPKIEDTQAELSKAMAYRNISKLLNKIPFPQFIGSNGFVLAPKKTTTGKVLFENDPHISYAQPSVWYQAHIKTPNYENYGFYLGLMPFPLLAHNRDYAFGITMFENDDINFYTLKNYAQDSTKYQSASGLKSYEYKTKEIKIKGEKSHFETIKNTHLGAVCTSQIKALDSLNPVVVNWVYNENQSKVLQASYGINHVKNIQEFEKELEALSAPGLNYVYGDRNNNIGLWSVGKLFTFDKETNTKFILNGLDTISTHKKWLPFAKNPKKINPVNGYVLTSNTQPDAIDGTFYQGYYLPKDRGVAITKSIEAKEKLSVNDVKNIATSHTNTTARNNVFALAKHIDINKLSDKELIVLDKLLKWKGNHYKDIIGPTIYYKVLFNVFKNTFEDELGEDLFSDFVSTSLYKRTINVFLEKQNSVWWDNVKTKAKENQKQVITQTFKQSVNELENQLGTAIESWRWERVHNITHEHALAKIDILKKILNVGPFPVVGGNETVNNIMFDFTTKGVYTANAGPSTRRIVDFSNIENSYAILPTGQSGNFLSPYYKNQTDYYNTGKYYKMLLNDTEIKASQQKIVFQ